MLFKLLLAITCTEAIVEIVVKSELFNPIKAKVFDLSQTSRLFGFIHYLLDCGYCFSVWVGMFIAVLFFKDIGLIHSYIDWFFMGLFLHRGSNLLHNTMDRIYNAI